MLPLSHDPLAEDFHDNSRNAQPLFRMMVHVPYFFRFAGTQSMGPVWVSESLFNV